MMLRDDQSIVTPPPFIRRLTHRSTRPFTLSGLISLSLMLGLCVGQSAAQGGSPQPERSAKPQMRAGLEERLTAFEGAVKRRDRDALLKSLDPDYIRKQRDLFLRGNTKRFIDELWCGEEVLTQSFKCAQLDQVVELERVKLTPSGERRWTVTYRFTRRVQTRPSENQVVQQDHTLLIDFEVVVSPQGSGAASYKIIGAVG